MRHLISLRLQLSHSVWRFEDSRVEINLKRKFSSRSVAFKIIFPYFSSKIKRREEKHDDDETCFLLICAKRWEMREKRKLSEAPGGFVYKHESKCCDVAISGDSHHSLNIFGVVDLRFERSFIPFIIISQYGIASCALLHSAN